jgi:hypothetical protein
MSEGSTVCRSCCQAGVALLHRLRTAHSHRATGQAGYTRQHCVWLQGSCWAVTHPGGKCTTTAKTPGVPSTGAIGMVSTHLVNEPHRCTCTCSTAIQRSAKEIGGCLTQFKLECHLEAGNGASCCNSTCSSSRCCLVSDAPAVR